MITTSPKSSLAKLGLSKQRPLRVMVIGQGGVGKTGNLKLILTHVIFHTTIIYVIHMNYFRVIC